MEVFAAYGDGGERRLLMRSWEGLVSSRIRRRSQRGVRRGLVSILVGRMIHFRGLERMSGLTLGNDLIWVRREGRVEGSDRERRWIVTSGMAF